MKYPKYFTSCDWGTSNFRLSVVETETLAIQAEHETDQGIKTLYQKYTRQSTINQFNFFSNYLLDQIQVLSEEHRKNLILVSGMASANIGMLELEYAELPFDNTGSNLVRKHLTLSNGSKAILISGAKSESGIMRGEETQALGLSDHLYKNGDGMLLLPGTHSKHINYKNGAFSDLKTYMTGELFELLSKQSILENNVNANSFDSTKEDSFIQGVNIGFEGKLTSSLFSIRVTNLLKNSKKDDNYYFLSGLLIGDELSNLKNYPGNIYLAAPASTEKLYKLAIKNILPELKLVNFDLKIISNTLLEGHRKILNLYYV